jgi:hypothetical protein
MHRSRLGDFGGELVATSDAFAAAKILHYLPEETGNLSNAASIAISSIVQSALSLEQEALNALR